VRLRQRTALISGAGGPMGLAIARRFAEEGASLILTDISGNRLTAAVEAVGATLTPGAKLSSTRANVLVREEAAAVVAAGIGEAGHVDILVNVVGGIRSASMFESFLEMTEERWNATFELNLKGTFHLVQLVAPAMLERKQGKIINLSSIIFAGVAGNADYGAAKAAVASMTKSLAMEFAPSINVNCIAPATINTSVIERLSEEQKSEWRGKTLLKRFGEPDDVAHAALYLASEESAYVTGEVLAVSGGIWPAL
jgi:3-oxoacyl-[acyl-carrier protein] reductase